MKILIRGDKVAITDSMRQYAEEKLNKLNKYIKDESEITANVLVKERGPFQKVEITIPLKTFILRAEEKQESFPAALDLLIDKLERQIRKTKTKLEAKYVKENRAFIYDNMMEDIEEEDTGIVIKRKKVEVKPMDEEEAILQMELIGHEFYLYKDAETLKYAVVYKRRDGGYGMIEAE